MTPRRSTWFTRALRLLLALFVGALIVRRDVAPVDARPQAPATAATSAPAAPAGSGSAAARPAAATAASPQQAFLNQYCITCHNQRVKAAGLTIDAMDVANVGAHAEAWERVVRKIRTGMMPPSGVRRPEREALDAFARELETRLDAAVAPNATLTTPALHRLNRTEYANAVRDLLALTIDADTLLPPDGSSEGFDNIAEALSVSPSLIQSYVSAAMKISRQAVGDRSMAPVQITYAAPPALAQDRHIDGLPLGTRGGMLVHHTFPLDAEYEFSIAGGGPGGLAPTSLDFTIDGEPVTVSTPRSFRLKVKAGPRALGLALVDRQRGAGVDEIYSDFRVNGTFTAPGAISTLVITGPFAPTGVGDTPSRQQVFVCRPATAAEEVPCARRILGTLARRAYRGPVSAPELDTLMTFYAQGREQADFDTGIQQALARVLVAPRFVFRAESEPAALKPGSVYRISDVDLASRLSFFLWSSIPDEELLAAAEKGTLHQPAVLEKQVRRMLADRRSSAIIENFAGQWLFLRELETVQSEAQTFDDNLRRGFRRETELLFDSVVREDRSLLTLLDADYTFVDERLARHYGIPNVRGSHFRRVSLATDNPRRGLLGQGSFLTVTSVATRTSPVSRGKWVLENVLGTPAPVPPPGVETNLEPKAGETKPTTLRQRLEMHRASPVCASCHKIMDPMGFSLENFDLVGAWRERDAGSPIDATGQLADGTPLDGPADLRAALLSRSEMFVTTAAQKLMIYALGRPVHHDDMPEVRAIVRRAAQNDNRFSALVMGVVQSAPFQKRVKKS